MGPFSCCLIVKASFGWPLGPSFPVASGSPVATNPFLACELSQKGGFFVLPHRQIVARIDRSVCLAYLPSGEEADVFLFPEMELTEDHGSASGPLLMTIGVTDEVRNERIDLELEIEVEKGGR